MEKSLIKNGLRLLSITFFFCSCERIITGCYSFKEYGSHYAMVLNDDSTYSYNLRNWEGFGKYSFGRYSIDNNKLILNSTYSKITDSLEVISSKMKYQGFIRMVFHYIRGDKRIPHGVRLRVKNSLIDTFFYNYTISDTLIFFDYRVDKTILEQHMIGFTAFDIKDVAQSSYVSLITDDRDYPIIIDTTANNYSIFLYSSTYDSLRQYRFFENEEWGIRRRQVFDPKRKDVFRKTKKCPNYYR